MDKEVVVAFGLTGQTFAQALLQMTQLQEEARKMDVLPTLQNTSLLNIKVLTDNGYTANFYPHKKVQLYTMPISSQSQTHMKLYSKGGEMEMTCGEYH